MSKLTQILSLHVFTMPPIFIRHNVSIMLVVISSTNGNETQVFYNFVPGI